MNFRDSWTMSKACFKVLWDEKMLVVFPLVSMLATGLIMMFLLGAMVFATISANILGGSGMIVYLIFSFLYFFILYTVAIFSNVAIVGCARKKLDGGKPTLSDGWRIASQRIGAVIAWAIVAATVGVILQVIRSLGKVGEIAASLLGWGWNILTYFVVPVIAYENVGPIKAMSRSKDILKRTWGEALVSNISISLIFFLASLPLILVLCFLLILSAATGSIPMILTSIFLLVIAIILIWAIHTALKGILMAALYRYATTGRAGLGIGDDAMRNMFTQKRRGISKLF